MDVEEFSFLNKSIALEEREKLDSSYKIRSYIDKFKLMKQKKFPQSEKIVRKLLTLDEKNKDAWKILSIILNKQGKYVESEEASKKAKRI